MTTDVDGDRVNHILIVILIIIILMGIPYAFIIIVTVTINIDVSAYGVNTLFRNNRNNATKFVNTQLAQN